MNVVTSSHSRRGRTAAVGILRGLTLTLSLVSGAYAAGTCDPTISSCVPGSGGGSTCSPISASLGLCTPGSGGGGGGGGGVCTAPPGGSPTCSGSGAATQGGGSTPSSGAGNPINLLNGNKYQEETDLTALPGVLGLELKRYYNSQSTHPGLLGANWRISYETVLYDLGSEIQIVQADGRRLMFQRGIGQSATLCSSPQPQDGQVRIEPAKDGKGQPTYYWRWADGRTLMFSSGSGGGYPLQSITAATGERVTLNYSPTGEITSIRDPQGRQLVFIYASAAEKRSRALKAIDTPLGRLTYSQDALGRLTEVGQAKDTTSAPFVTRLYHYEDRYSAGHPQALTGISVRGPDPQTHQITEQRLSTYVYNAAGLAILSTKGRPREMKDGKQVADTGIEQVEVAYLDKPLPQDVKVDRRTGEATPTRLGKAILTNSLGQTTQVTSALIAGHFRLMEMRGPGCSTCGPGNMRYAYDAQGLLIRSTRLDDNGMPVRSEVTELDKYGRTARVGVQDYAGGKAQSTRWTQRFEYPDVRYPDGSVAVAPQPSLIAGPSVIQGKEHTVAISYNGFGQTTQITETGFSPADKLGQLNPTGTPLSRTITTTYRTINGRSLPVQFDGPIAEQATRLQWDKNGDYLAKSTFPGELVTYDERDAAGRVIRHTDADGLATSYAYDAATPTRPTRIDHVGEHLSFRFDQLGQIVQAGDSDARRIDLRYDLAGHVIGVADAQGYKAEATLDTEGQNLVDGLYEPGRSSPLRATYRWYDDQRRIVKQLRADGRIESWRYDATGDLDAHSDGDEVVHFMRTSRFGLRARIDLAPDGLVNLAMQGNNQGGSARALPRQQSDDFGRVVLVWRPEQGIELRSFDNDDHIVRKERLDLAARPAGHIEQVFDASGRLQRQRSYDASGHLVHAVERKYVGTRLVEQRDDAQDSRYVYDEAGRIVRTDLTLLDDRHAPFYSATLGTSYGADDEAASRMLADGSVMRVMRGPTGVATSIALQSEFWASAHERLGRWLPASLAARCQELLPAEVVVRDITFHPYNGVTGMVYGNGFATRKEFDIAGRLVALKVAGDQTIMRYGVGPRIRAVEEVSNGRSPMKTQYDYDGFGSLRSDNAARPLRTSLTTPGAQFGSIDRPATRDALGRTDFDGRYRYTYTEGGQIQTVEDDGGKKIATYRYNADGQRISKTVLGETTYYLWSFDRVVAEIDGSGEHRGQVAVQYLHLSDAGEGELVAKLEASWAPGNDTARPRTLYVHSDHRRQPVALTDKTQHVVWHAGADAWGFVDTAVIAQQHAVMNIRLPGQYFDSETGLHDNWHRTYDARPGTSTRGSYLTPDPIGYPNGPDPYAYVGGDPINGVDPTGLYEEDVHYYMTYFLAIVAGLTPAEALTIASADRYIDDNPNTEPYGTLGTNLSARQDYHFTQDGYDTTTNPATRYLNPVNPQLTRLHGDATGAPTSCAKNQFYGEYLHAYEDTYAHRDADNEPYGAKSGHVSGGHNPDYTYNHKDSLGRNWQYNEARTSAMEHGVFDLFKADYHESSTSPSGAAISWVTIQSTVEDFNKNPAPESAMQPKIAILQSQLHKWGFAAIPTYSCELSKNMRNTNLRDASGKALQQANYPGTILATPTAAQPCK